MKTLGETLRGWRSNRKWSRQTLAASSGLNLNIIDSLENDQPLNSQLRMLGALQTLAITYQEPYDTLVAIWRRDASPKAEIVIKKRFVSNYWWRWSLTGLLIIGIGMLALRYWQRLDTDLRLTIDSPINYSEVSSPVVVDGKTLPNASVTINNQPITLQSDGSFTHSMDLPSGNRALVIVSTDQRGRTVEDVRFFSVKEN